MKKAGSTVLLLAALLAAILELHTACGQSTTEQPTVTVPTEKPGVCPPERYYKKGRFNDSYCETDADCEANEKCCVDNFDKLCKPPAEERDGQCPPTSYDETSQNRTDDWCTSDSECAPTSKCCFKDGGKTCVPPVGVKKGECRPNPIRCFRGWRPACINDSTCQGNEKCCSSKCGMQCLDPNKELNDTKQDVVPNQEYTAVKPVCPPPQQELSDTKQDVVPNQEYTAVKPVCPPPRQEGFCPPDTTPPDTMTICLVKCDNCKETEMCCSSGCLKECKEMTKERPGYCPRDNVKCAPRDILCDNDLNCTDTEKCCISKCVKQCVPLLTEKPGECPVPSTSCQSTNDTPDTVCSKDLHCKGDQKCCIVGCSKNCTEPTFVTEYV